jgi:hypothetical protein
MEGTDGGKDKASQAEGQDGLAVGVFRWRATVDKFEPRAIGEKDNAMVPGYIPQSFAATYWHAVIDQYFFVGANHSPMGQANHLLLEHAQAQRRHIARSQEPTSPQQHDQYNQQRGTTHEFLNILCSFELASPQTLERIATTINGLSTRFLHLCIGVC